MKPVRLAWQLWAIALVLIITAPLALAQPALDKPMLVVATPALVGPYRGTVILATPILGAHMGVILNRPTDVKLGDLFPEHPPSAAVTDPVYLGGPDERDALFALVRGEAPDPSAISMGPGVWLVHRGDVVDAVIAAQGDRARYFVGMVAWKPGELARELSQGMFAQRPFDPAKLFLPDTQHLYEELAPKKGQLDT